MPLTTSPWPDGPGRALPDDLRPTETPEQISNAVGMITAGNMFGGVGGIPALQNIFGWRVDRQNAPSGFVNLSVQRNGVGAPSTVATVFVPVRYNLAPPAPNAGPAAAESFRARMRELERAVRNGLEWSFKSTPPAPSSDPGARYITRYQVEGEFSS